MAAVGPRADGRVGVIGQGCSDLGGLWGGPTRKAVSGISSRRVEGGADGLLGRRPSSGAAPRRGTLDLAVPRRRRRSTQARRGFRETPPGFLRPRDRTIRARTIPGDGNGPWVVLGAR
jgi:hypothetical protein